jgi:hypothetical protein
MLLSIKDTVKGFSPQSMLNVIPKEGGTGTIDIGYKKMDEGLLSS